MAIVDPKAFTTEVEEALHWCGHRTAKREAQKVEGTHAVHA